MSDIFKTSFTFNSSVKQQKVARRWFSLQYFWFWNFWFDNKQTYSIYNNIYSLSIKMNNSIMEIITAKLRSLQISFSRIFWTSFEMTWVKFKPNVTSTPKKSNSKTIVDCTMETLSSLSIIAHMDIDSSPQPSPEV